MANEILDSTKDLLGIPAEVTEFNTQLVGHINLVLFNLTDIGVGTEGYQITAETGSFDTFMPGDDLIHAALQMYIYMKVRLLFDPPTTAFVLKSLEAQIKELEWRLTDYSYVEPVV
jgi:hypothetical protein